MVITQPVFAISVMCQLLIINPLQQMQTLDSLVLVLVPTLLLPQVVKVSVVPLNLLQSVDKTDVNAIVVIPRLALSYPSQCCALKLVPPIQFK